MGDRVVCNKPSLPGFSGEGGCRERHDIGGLTLDEWEANGLPGSGWSACRGNCRCLLVPDQLLEIEGEVLEPFDILSALNEIVDEDDPIEKARQAANIRLIEDFQPGTRVVYMGPISRLRGQTALVSSVDVKHGAEISFEFPLQGFPEFHSLQVFDLTELVISG